jgi:hypothetical protein
LKALAREGGDSGVGEAYFSQKKCFDAIALAKNERICEPFQQESVV